jgi:hypothetical protein
MYYDPADTTCVEKLVHLGVVGQDQALLAETAMVAD